MTKSELIERIAQKQTLLTSRDVEGAVNAILEHMTERLATGGRIEIRGFGAFSLRHRKVTCRSKSHDGTAAESARGYTV